MERPEAVRSSPAQVVVPLGIAVVLTTVLLLLPVWEQAMASNARMTVPASHGQASAALSNGAVITIGVGGPFSGSAATYGWQSANAVQLAVNETNAAGGIQIGGVPYSLVVAMADSQCDPSQAATAANALLDAGAAAVVGHVCSVESLSAQPVYSAAGVPMVSPASSYPPLTQQGYTTTFRTNSHDGAPAALLARYFRNWAGLSRSATVMGGGYWSEPVVAEAYESTFSALGGTITGRHTVGSTSDFVPVLTTIKAENPDVIFYSDPDPSRAGQFSRVACELGMCDVVIGWDGWDSSASAGGDSVFATYVSTAGPAAEGDYAAMSHRAFEDMAGWPTFLAAYQAASFPNEGNDPGITGAFAYDAARIIISAIERAGSADPAAIRDQIAATRDHEGVVGTYRGFDAHGDVFPQWAWLERYRIGQWHKVDIWPVTLNVNLGGEPRTLDPAKVIDSLSIHVIEQLFVGLVDLNDTTAEVEPELASSWEISPDGMVYTFTLRNDAIWSDGQPITAEDVRYGILRSLNPATASDWALEVYIIKNAQAYNTGTITDPNEVGVATLDHTHLRITLEHPASYALSALSLWCVRPMPRWAIEAWGDDWTAPEHIVSSGPYLLREWVHDDHILLDKNPFYWDAARVQIEEIRMRMVNDTDAWQMYLNGELDTAAVPSGLALDPTLQREAYSQPIAYTFYYGFSVSQPPCDILLLRKAFAAATDRQGLIDNVRGGLGQPALTFTPPGIFGHVDGYSEGIGIPYDPGQAQQWLADAGYPSGQGLPPLTLWFGFARGQPAIAEFLQTNWYETLGISVTLQGLPWGEYLNQVSAGQLQLWVLGWGADYNDAHNYLHDALQDPQHFGNWHNASYENLISEAAQGQNPQTRWALYKQVEEILVETDVVMVPLFYSMSEVTTKPYLQRTYPRLGVPDVSTWRIFPVSRLRISPASKVTFRCGGPITMEVYAQDISTLTGFEFSLSFDPSIVHVDSMALGSLITGSGRTFVPLGPQVDNSAGTADFGAFSYGTEPAPSGSGPIATITLSPVGSGQSHLAFDTVQLTDWHAVPVHLFSRDACLIVLPPLVGDVDCDCDVDVVDIMLVASRWQAHSGDPNYEPQYDMDHDGDIDIVDIMRVAIHWSEQCSFAQGQAGAARWTELSARDRLPVGPERRISLPKRMPRDESYTVEIVADNVASLGGFELTFLFDPALLRVESVTLGEFLGSTGRSALPLGPLIDNAAGSVSLGGFSYGTATGPNGKGTLATITLRPLAAGPGNLTLSRQQCTDTAGQLCPGVRISVNGADDQP